VTVVDLCRLFNLQIAARSSSQRRSKADVVPRAAPSRWYATCCSGRYYLWTPILCTSS